MFRQMNMNVIFYMNVDVSFLVPMTENSNLRRYVCKCVTGFMQEFGCTATSFKMARKMIEKYIFLDFPREKVRKISYSWVGIIPPETVNDEIYGDKEISNRLLSNPMNAGVWYRTGHAFYYGNRFMIWGRSFLEGLRKRLHSDSITAYFYRLLRFLDTRPIKNTLPERALDSSRVKEGGSASMC